MANAPVMQQLHGKYYSQARTGNFFIGSTAAAGVIPPVYNATAQTFGLFNPAGNVFAANICFVKGGLVTVGIVTSNFCWVKVANAPTASLGSSTNITAFNSATPATGLVGGPAPTNTVLFTPAGTTTTTASTYLWPIGQSQVMASAPAAANTFASDFREDYDGTFILMPGNAVFVANNIAGVATWNLSVGWYEVPLVNGIPG